VNHPPAQANDPRRELVESLEQTILLLSSSSHVKLACERFNEAVSQSDGAVASGATRQFKEDIEPLTTLVKTADVLDPHILTAEELEGLGHSPTDELVRAALTKGALRERRILLQAAEANTNRRIARWAIGAIVVNACATIVAAVL
jgi:nitrogen-specific signal transduction histidine kinase